MPTQQPRSIFVFGGKSTALEIRDAALAVGFHKAWFVVPDNEDPNGVDRIARSKLSEFVAINGIAAGFILSMSDHQVRRECFKAAESASLKPVSVVHPTAVLSPSAHLGDGSYVAACAVVSAEAIVQNHVLINYHAIVGHDCAIGDSSSILPAARIGGNCTVGARVMIGSGAFIHQGKKIGDDVVIDAMTYIDRDIPAGHICSCRRSEGKPIKRAFFRSNASST